MPEKIHTIDVSPEGMRTDYLNEIVGLLYLAESYVKGGVFDAVGFHEHLKDVLDELGRKDAVCSFEAVHQNSPEKIAAQPAAFIAATRSIAQEFNDFFYRGLLTVEIIRDLSGRLERLKKHPEAELSLQEFTALMAPEVATTTYIQDMSALYSVAKAMVEQRDKIEQLGLDEHILDIFDGEEGRLVVPFSERFQNEPDVLKTIPPEFVQAFDDLAEALNQRFRDRTLMEDHVVDIFHRMEALKKQLITGRS